MTATAPAALGPSPTLAGLARLLDAAEASLQAPEVSLAQLRTNRSDEVFELPPEHRFDGYDTKEIPIVPKQRNFETLADAAAWAMTAVAAWPSASRPKPTLPRHTVSKTRFVYPLVTRSGEASVALFSDWGTGYYHSRYIAKHIGWIAPGRPSTSATSITSAAPMSSKTVQPILEKYIMPRMPLFAMNANHEMDSHGIAYFDSSSRSAAGGAGGRPPSHRKAATSACTRTTTR